MPNDLRPTLIYDGECGFCRDSVARWQALTGPAIEYLPLQARGERFPDVGEEACRASVQLVDGAEVHAGAAAVFRVLALGGGWSSIWLGLYRAVPPLAWLSETAYRWVARHRSHLAGPARRIWGSGSQTARHLLSRWLFLRMLGVIYLAAFISCWVQVDGLVGVNGILPASKLLSAVETQLGPGGWRYYPTLCWLIGASDQALNALCAAGVALSLLLIEGVAPRLSLVGLWGCYLSLAVVGQDFFSFQWDTLLLETGFLAIFLAPAGWFPTWSREARPSPLALLLLRFLLVKLMFLAGAVKLLSNDPSWWSLTALQVHFETQPLPTWIGWYAHQLPAWLLGLAALLTLAIELLLPPLLLVLAARAWARWAVCLGLGLLQLAILLSGNFGYFNALSLALCLLVLNDNELRRILPGWFTTRLPRDPARRPAPFAWGLLLAIAAPLILTVSTLRIVQKASPGSVPRPARAVLYELEPWSTINRYGLFGVMTAARLEITFEGSRDGTRWEPYVFRHKPQRLDRRPHLLPLHMPRLDWQMWFAALSGGHTMWIDDLADRIMQGSPAVLDLFAENPFAERPPQHLRAVIARYRFSDWTTQRRDGVWWVREEPTIVARWGRRPASRPPDRTGTREERRDR